MNSDTMGIELDHEIIDFIMTKTTAPHLCRPPPPVTSSAPMARLDRLPCHPLASQMNVADINTQPMVHYYAHLPGKVIIQHQNDRSALAPTTVGKRPLDVKVTNQAGDLNDTMKESTVKRRRTWPALPPGTAAAVTAAVEASEPISPTSKRKARNLKEQQRSHALVNKIEGLRRTLPEKFVPYKPDKISTLGAVERYMERLKQHIQHMHEEYRQLAASFNPATQQEMIQHSQDVLAKFEFLPTFPRLTKKTDPSTEPGLNGQMLCSSNVATRKVPGQYLETNWSCGMDESRGSSLASSSDVSDAEESSNKYSSFNELEHSVADHMEDILEPFALEEFHSITFGNPASQ